MAGAHVRAAVLLALGCALAVASTAAAQEWLRAHATFYGGADASGYGTRTTALFGNGALCGQCFKLVCDRKTGRTWCTPGVSFTVTNFCSPNWDLPSYRGGWCNPPRLHFDMAQPAWEKIGVYRGGIIPVIYRRVPCVKRGGVRFTINNHDYFNLVLVTNVAGPGSIKAMGVRGSKQSANNWVPMARTRSRTSTARGCPSGSPTDGPSSSTTSCRPTGGPDSPSPATCSSISERPSSYFILCWGFVSWALGWLSIWS